MHQKPLILVSNDDGYLSPGIRILARYLKRLGSVVVVAPDQQRSTASHSLTLHRPLRVFKISPNLYAVDGTPTDCITLAVNRLLKRRPDLIVSGINDGPNLGDDVHYSGTVSAAMEGGILGIPAIAVSLANQNGRRYFQTAARFALKLARAVLKNGLPEKIILNVNVPSRPWSKISAHVFTIQGKRDYGGIIVEKLDPRGRKYYWIGGAKATHYDRPGSDCNAVAEGQISITPLRVDLTHADALIPLRGWKL